MCAGPSLTTIELGPIFLTFAGVSIVKTWLLLQTNRAKSGVVPSMTFRRKRLDLNMVPYLHTSVSHIRTTLGSLITPLSSFVNDLETLIVCGSTTDKCYRADAVRPIHSLRKCNPSGCSTVLVGGNYLHEFQNVSSTGSGLGGH